MARRVTAPDGVDWRIERQWAPFRVRMGRVRRDAPDTGGDTSAIDVFGVLDDAGGLVASLVVIAVAALLFLVVWPVVAIAVEIAVLVIATLLGAAARFARVRPWTIRAEARDGRGRERRVHGWRASGELMDRVAESLASRGQLPPARPG